MSESAIFKAAVKLTPERRAAYLDETCGASPELRREVESLLRAHDASGSFLQDPPARPQATVADPPIAEGPGTVIGPYKLLQQIGEGGMGVVYMAEQQEPVRRKVALKIIKPGLDSRQVVARFEAERQALAMMDHQNIAKVLDAGTTDSGRPYFVMELVHGIALTQYCDDNQLTPRQRLELFVPICQAIQHAHQKGIIHCDVKPSNVLVTMYDDKPVPKVIDFGVAKAVEQRLTEKTLFTQFGTLVGTFEYMSPEQAEMNAFGVDTRSDVYSLGVLLYELLTGSTPLERQRLRAAAYGEIVRLIKEEEPPRPSTRLSSSGAALDGISRQRGSEPDKLTRLVRGELDWIVMRCLEKDRTRRYETAIGLARDVERYLHDEPVEACPPTAGYRLRKFARKHQTILATAAAFAVLLLLGVLASTWQAVRATEAEAAALLNERHATDNALQANQKEQEANQQRNEAQRQRDEVKKVNEKLLATQAELRSTLYAAHMNLAQHAWEARGIDRVRELLANHLPKPGESDLRGFEWHFLNRLCHADILRLGGGPIYHIAYSLDGKRIAGIADMDFRGAVRVWNARTGKELFSLPVQKLWVKTVTFSPDGTTLACGVGGEVKLWDAQTGKELRALKGGGMGVAYSPDGKRLASSGFREMKVWDARTGQELLTFDINGSGANVAFSPDGKRLASITGKTGGKTVKVWDAQTGQELLSIQGGGRRVAFSPDGKRLASAVFDDQKVKVWDAQTGQELLALKGSGINVAFSPDGKRLACPNSDGMVKVWDAQTGKELFSFKGFGEGLCVAFSPDGKHLAHGGSWGVRAWDVQSSNPLIIPLGAAPRSNVAFSPDGRRLAFGFGNKNMVKVLNAKTGQELLTFKGGGKASVAFSPDGRYLTSPSEDWTVKVWDAQTGQELLAVKGRGTGPVFSPDGLRLASGGSEATVWDAQAGQKLLVLEAKIVQGVAFSPDGKRLAGGTSDGTVKVWDAQTGKELLSLKGHTYAVWRVAFSADGKRLASTSAGKTVKLWDAQTGKELLTLKGHTGGVVRVAFSPDGKRVATGSEEDKTVKLWDAQTGQELFSLKHTRVLSVAFSPDGHRLAAGSGDGTVTIWDATPLPEKPKR